jgi:general secretion pathway protein M
MDEARSLPAQLAPVRAWWAARAPRERGAVVAATVVVGAALVWAVAVLPAWRTLREAPRRIDALDVQLQLMQRQAADARALRATPAVAPAQAAAALKAATERFGDKVRLLQQGERAVLTITGLQGEEIGNLLAEVRSGARASAVEANLARSAQGYSGTLVVALGGARP